MALVAKKSFPLIRLIHELLLYTQEARFGLKGSSLSTNKTCSEGIGLLLETIRGRKDGI